MIFRFKLICVLLAICVPLLTVSSPSASLLPDNLIIEDEFKPGYGLPVGKVQELQGDVVVMHADKLRGYWAKKSLPLYQGDTIFTMETGRVRFGLKDGSTLTLSSDTKLIISISVYNPKKKVRSSFFNMVFGKVLFAVRKLTDYKISQVKTKTQTAVCGVRGSQWVQVVTDTYTEITALIRTKLGVISTAYPEVEPVILEDFDQTTVYEGQLPSKVIKVSNKKLKQFEEDFTITPEEDAEEYKGGEGTVAEGYQEVLPEIVLPENTLIENIEHPYYFEKIDREEYDPIKDQPKPYPKPQPRPELADLPSQPTR
jgi:hypothetical protein